MFYLLNVFIEGNSEEVLIPLSTFCSNWLVFYVSEDKL